MRDSCGRPLRDLRISVTRDCQLACTFCHHEGAHPGPQALAPQEIGRLVAVAAGLGVRRVKLTGGEPLMRRDLEDIVAEIRPLVDEVSLVTNGHLLGRRAASLRAAGLDRANVSVHSLDPEVYERITRCPGPPLAALQEARQAGLPVKANMVVTRQTADHVRPLVEWGCRTGTPVQLIELHGPPELWPRLAADHVNLDPVEAWLAARALHKSMHELHARPRYHLDGTTVDVTRPMGNWRFCAACTRLRVTADGRLQTCLLRPRFVGVLEGLRRADSAQLEDAFQAAVALRRPTWEAPAPAPALAPAPAPVAMASRGSP